MMATRWLRRPPAECRRVAAVLQLYLDAELDDRTAAEVAAHLEVCRDCGMSADTYLDLKASLARRRRPDDDAVDRLRAFVHEMTAPDPGL